MKGRRAPNALRQAVRGEGKWVCDLTDGLFAFFEHRRGLKRLAAALLGPWVSFYGHITSFSRTRALRAGMTVKARAYAKGSARDLAYMA